MLWRKCWRSWRFDDEGGVAYYYLPDRDQQQNSSGERIKEKEYLIVRLGRAGANVSTVYKQDADDGIRWTTELVICSRVLYCCV